MIILASWEIIARLLLAAGLGSVIGLERERRLWAAGLRTHMLVAVGACLMMIVSMFGFTSVLTADHVSLDPSRVAAQVVSGIGFLGAGSIMMLDDKIRGLTTAASVWAVAGIGLAVGGGLYTAAIAATLIIFIILAGVKPLEERFISRRHTVEMTLKAKRDTISARFLNEALGTRKSRLRQLVVRAAGTPDVDEVKIVLERVALEDIAQIRLAIKELPCVLSIDEVHL